jgi:CheY-like chemotaxis protein
MSERARILLVDDRPENLLALEAILSALDQVLVRASSGEEALRELLKDEYALILLDAHMPGMDGFETAARIKRRARTKDIPIIFLTAADSENRNSYRGYAVGGADYITKPFDPWILRAKVQVFVDLWAAGRRLATQASLLRGQVGGDPGPSGALAVLGDRVHGVTDALAALEQAVEAGAQADVRAATAGVRREVDGLRDALAAMDVAVDGRREPSGSGEREVTSP